jgi:hypothetical protein
MGSATLEGRVDMGEKVIINIKTSSTATRPPTASTPRCSESEVRNRKSEAGSRIFFRLAISHF